MGRELFSLFPFINKDAGASRSGIKTTVKTALKVPFHLQKHLPKSWESYIS